MNLERKEIKLKKLKNKNIIFGLIAILVVMSVGFVVNSYYVERPTENKENYSEALNKDFTGEVSIYNKTEFGIQAPGEQFWDGLDDTEKENRTLIVPKNKKIDGKIKYNEYEDFVIHKYGKNKQPLEGVKFCIAKQLTNVETENKTEDKIIKMLKCDEAYNSLTENWVTNKEGILKIPTNELPLYNQTIIETSDMQDTYKPIKLDIYVDPGNRFLGEVKGTDFITYADLIKFFNDKYTKEFNKSFESNNLNSSSNENILTPIGNPLSLGNDETGAGNWLKIYDARTNKTLYIAKKPITNNVSWEMLYKAGAVFGTDLIDPNTKTIRKSTKDHGGEIPQTFVDNFLNLEKQRLINIAKAYKTTTNENGKYDKYKPSIVEINGKRYIVRLLKGHTTIKNGGDPNKSSEAYEGKDVTNGSEWNRYILPLVKSVIGERWGSTTVTEDCIEKNLISDKIQLATYTWFGDMTLGAHSNVWNKGQKTWVQELEDSSDDNRALRGHYYTTSGAAFSNSYYSYNAQFDKGFRPVLEEIPQNCYDGACFEGEVKGTDFITYDELIATIDGESNPKVTQYNAGDSTNKIGKVLSKGNDSSTGGNWLKIYDAQEGKTLYIAKKPLTNYVSWDKLYDAGVVYGLDMLDKTGKPKDPLINTIYGGKTYQGKIININGKPYIVRLLKGNNRTNWTPKQTVNKVDSIEMTQHSEWNRYILPIVKYNRFGSSTKSTEEIEQELKQDINGNIMYWNDTNKDYKVQLEKYKWFGDLTVGTNSYGNYSWMQEFGIDTSRRVIRGYYYTNYGAAMASYNSSGDSNSGYGFRPVLEEIN